MCNNGISVIHYEYPEVSQNLEVMDIAVQGVDVRTIKGADKISDHVNILLNAGRYHYAGHFKLKGKEYNYTIMQDGDAVMYSGYTVTPAECTYTEIANQ
ncbi:hypothetical protein BN1222_03578 [Klebsiella quasipneumoniae]|nr:hypothetical protein BN1222_03578 [Klebsiella quasipneumoniae]